MEFLDGETLAACLRRGPLPEAEELRIALQLCAGVAEAHRKGVIHGDLKTANVILTSVAEGGLRAVITDFGLARNAAASLSAAKSDVAGGTPGYMAPELLKGEKASVASDIFALGVILCELHLGHKPHDTSIHFSPSASTVTRTSSFDPLISREDQLTRKRRSVHPKWDRVLLRCLDPDPLRRFNDADEVMEALNPPHKRRWGFYAGFIILLFALASAVFWWRKSPTLGGTPNLSLRRLTAGDVATSVSLSPDGKKVVYSSDRSGSLDLWLQDLAGGEAVRLTSDASAETDPVFSPDGNMVAFRSNRDGGGIYVMSASGNNKRLIAAGGRDPSYSPDGKWIAYWEGTPSEGDLWRAGSAQSFVVSVKGGAPRQITINLANVSHPIFSPDGQHLLVRSILVGRIGETYFLVDLATGKSIELTIAKELGAQGLPHPLIQVWTKTGIFFSAGRGDEMNIWYAPASARLILTGAPELLTSSTSETSHVSISGRKVAFFNGERQDAIWLLPIDANLGNPLGPIRRVMSRSGTMAHPNLSPDGKQLVFRVFSKRSVDLILRNLETGDERLIAQRDKPELAGRFLADNATVLYEAGASGEGGVMQWDVRSGRGYELFKYGSAMGPSANGRWISYWVRQDNGSNSIWVAERGTGAAAEILSDNHSQMYVQRFSPDDRWMSFLARDGPERSRIFIAPFRGLSRIPQSEWVPILQERAMADKPEWSPDGGLLYYLSDRDGYRCIWAQRLAASDKRPVGSPFPVQHFHELRSSMLDVNLGHQGLSIAVDKIAFMLSEQSGGIWIADLPQNIP
jgi:Tol biopolymer transport system component